jgi:hypothetical protein
MDGIVVNPEEKRKNKTDAQIQKFGVAVRP